MGEVETANPDQLAAWDGDEGDHWTEHEDRYNDAVRAHSQRLLQSAAIAPTEHVLDLGCGCGESTRDAARAAVDGAALGIDLSSRMIDRARERAVEEGLANVSFVQGDAQVHPFTPESFDVVISRTGGMFFADLVAAYENVGRAMRPDGRLVLLTWQSLDRNEWLTAMRGALAMGRDLPNPPTGTPGPFGLADPEQVRATLGAAGFRDVELEDLDLPFSLGGDADEAYRFAAGAGIVRGLLQDLDADDRRAALANLRGAMDAHDTGDGVVFGSRAWLISTVR